MPLSKVPPTYQVGEIVRICSKKNDLFRILEIEGDIGLWYKCVNVDDGCDRYTVNNAALIKIIDSAGIWSKINEEG